MPRKFIALAGLLSLAKAAVPAETFSECRNVPPGSFVSSAQNCQAYVYCNGVESYTEHCPDGTYFDAAQVNCALAGSVYCKHDLLRPEETIEYVVEMTPTQPVLLPVTSTHLQRSECRAETDEYFPHPLRCEYYYRCSKGYRLLMHCNPNHGWDNRQQACAPIKEAVCFHYNSSNSS